MKKVGHASSHTAVKAAQPKIAQRYHIIHLSGSRGRQAFWLAMPFLHREVLSHTSPHWYLEQQQQQPATTQEKSIRVSSVSRHVFPPKNHSHG